MPLAIFFSFRPGNKHVTYEDEVDVEFDDGDSGRIPLSHIRWLPSDYPVVGPSPSDLLSWIHLFFCSPLHWLKLKNDIGFDAERLRNPLLALEGRRRRRSSSLFQASPEPASAAAKAPSPTAPPILQATPLIIQSVRFPAVLATQVHSNSSYLHF